MPSTTALQLFPTNEKSSYNLSILSCHFVIGNVSFLPSFLCFIFKSLGKIKLAKGTKLKGLLSESTFDLLKA